MKTTLAIVLASLFAGCTFESPLSPGPLKPGDYAGVFSLTANVGTDSAYVLSNACEFTFADSGWYSCRGSNILNPPAGAGPYRFKGNSLYLTDQAMHLAFFDWTLILNGSFDVRFNADSLILTQDDTQHRRYRYINLALNPQ